MGTKGQPEYEVAWKGFGEEHNRWYRLDMLQNARELVDDFENKLQTGDSIVNRQRQQQRKTKPSKKLRDNRA